MRLFRISILSAILLVGCTSEYIKNNDIPEVEVLDYTVEEDLPITVEVVEEQVYVEEAPNVVVESNTIDFDSAVNYVERYKNPREKTPAVDIYKSIEKHSKTYDINPAIIVGLAIRESDLTVAPKDSSKNCRGICQISRSALEDFNAKHQWPKYKSESSYYSWTDMFDYDKNIEVACWYLRWLWNNFASIRTIPELLVSYNAGPYKMNSYINKKGYTYDTFIIEKAMEFKSVT